jgi:hypothetical protein
MATHYRRPMVQSRTELSETTRERVKQIKHRFELSQAQVVDHGLAYGLAQLPALYWKRLRQSGIGAKGRKASKVYVTRRARPPEEEPSPDGTL